MSLKFLLVLKSFNGVSRLFKECLKFKGSFKDVLRKFQVVLRRFQKSFKEVSKVFQGSFKGILRKFQGYFKDE